MKIIIKTTGESTVTIETDDAPQQDFVDIVDMSGKVVSHQPVGPLVDEAASFEGFEGVAKEIADRMMSTTIDMGA